MTATAPQPGPQPGPPSATPVADAAGGDSGVAAALTRLEGVHERPLHEQPDVFQAVHTDLQNALAAIDHA